MTDKESLYELLEQGCLELGIVLDPEQIRMLLEYYDLVIDWNQKVNLTAIVDGKEFVVKHLIDSLSGAACLGEAGRLVDIGSGAGFPGIPLKILYPGLFVCLVESVNKKTEFLKTAVTALKLEGIQVVSGRAEEIGQNPAMRETFDFAVTRAVSKLAVIAEYCLPLVKVGGTFVAYKGEKVEEELLPGEAAIGALGGAIEQIVEVKLPFLGDRRTLIKVAKKGTTPAKYPRRIGVPAKRPLK